MVLNSKLCFASYDFRQFLLIEILEFMPIVD